MSGKRCLSPSVMADNFAGYIILDWLSLSFRILDALLQALWLSVSFEKSSVILMGFPVYVMCYFQSFQYSIFVIYSYIIVIICGDFV